MEFIAYAKDNLEGRSPAKKSAHHHTHRKITLRIGRGGAKRIGKCASSLSVPSLPALVSGRGPSPSARTTRSLPVTPSVPTEEEELQQKRRMHDESRAILHSMNVRESQAEKERERQQERLERLKRQKRSLMEDRTQQALKLLEKALEMDRVLAQDKERQELQLRTKLDEMKKRKGEKKEAEFVEIIDLKEK
ncbi:hypothetical protein ElyMa_004847200 [Elysia marginata]|uniref:Stathmin n=1 Tax=Elysia marginata TaxID=1093978 RepID=A0AAV4ISI0_9GAST|nr:hypothetical protein ElyMa_004847200 [Elysia marginata]